MCQVMVTFNQVQCFVIVILMRTRHSKSICAVDLHFLRKSARCVTTQRDTQGTRGCSHVHCDSVDTPLRLSHQVNIFDETQHSFRPESKLMQSLKSAEKTSSSLYDIS